MPSIGEVADEIKAQLEDIKTNTLGTHNNTNTIINQLTHLNSTTQSGFTNLAQGLAVLIQLQIQNNDLLASNNKQNATIICWLANMAHVLCDIKHNTDTEVKLQKQISATVLHLDDVLELVYPREGMDVKNRYDLEKRLDECCPKKEPEPQPCFKDCESPRLPDYNPIKQDWKPISYERPASNQPPK